MKLKWMALALSAVAGMSGCGDAASEGGSGDGLARLENQIEAGADCGALFAIRNDMEERLRERGEMEQANEALRSIGCFSAGSDRTD